MTLQPLSKAEWFSCLYKKLFTGISAIYRNNRAVEVIRGVTCQENTWSLHILALGSAPTAGGDAVGNLLISGVGRVQQRGVHLGSHIAGGNSVDIDASPSPLVTQGLGQQGNPALGGGVCRDSKADCMEAILIIFP